MWAIMKRGVLILLGLSTCVAPAPEGPQRLLERSAAGAPAPRVASVAVGGETRPALLGPAAFPVRVPPRGLLTFGYGVSHSGDQEVPGWYHVTVRAGDRTLFDKSLNPRAARGWRDVTVPLDGLAGEVTLAFDLRLRERDGRELTPPPGVVLAVADPIVHAAEGYGRAKGVILISIDTLRRDHVGAYGYPRPTTPRLDGLARGGLLCEDAVSTSSWTLPAHLSMLTSADPGAHGGTDMKHGYNRRPASLAATLQGAGYATQAVTSHLYVSSVYGLDAGFDHMDFHQDRKAKDVVDRAIDILDRVGDRPFFLFLHFYDPHWHYDPPEATLRLFETGYSGKLTGNWKDFSTRDRSQISPADLEHLLALYDGEIRYTDDEVGRLLDHMKTRGLDRGTLMVVTSDHGEEFLEHGSWEHQKTLYEEVIRIPMVVHGPGIAPRREAQQVSLLDVAPTVLAWAGVADPGRPSGKSLLTSPGEREAYGETDHTADGTRKLFLRGGGGRWKTILSLARGEPKVTAEEWYDLASDPGESKNAPPRESVAEGIRERAVGRWKAARGAGEGAPAVQLTPEQAERLKALGYVF